MCEAESRVEGESHGQAIKSLSDPATIYVPAHLLPPYSAPPLRVIVHRHIAVPLSSVILQAVQDTEAAVETSAIDMTAVRTFILRRIPALDGPALLRQGDAISVPLDTADVTFRILMLEPVRQGIPMSSTQLILSSETYIPPLEDELSYMDDADDARSSYARTHLSLSSFDPDAFLSGSLSLQTRADLDTDDTSREDGEWYPNGHSSEHSTETSGSTTPRALRPVSPAAPLREILPDGGGLDADEADEPDSGARFTAIPAAGPSANALPRRTSAGGVDEGEERDVCWVGVGGLGRAGIFEGDWVILRSTSESGSAPGRLVKVLAWERLDDEEANEAPDLPYNPILVPPSIYRSLLPEASAITSRSTDGIAQQVDVTLAPTSFGSRTPALPTAKSMTIARIATAEGLDKAYERGWIKGLRRYFSQRSHSSHEEAKGRLVRRGDVFALPISPLRPITAEEPLSSDSESDTDSDNDGPSAKTHMKMGKGGQKVALAWFVITGLSFDPLVPLEEDFRSSASSKARAGELGCWADVGDKGETKVVLAGVERARLGGKGRERRWYDIRESDSYTKCGDRAFLGKRQSCCIQLGILLISGCVGAGWRKGRECGGH